MNTMKLENQQPLEVIHYQDQVLELFLDQPNRRVIELYHRSQGRQDRFEYSADSYLRKYVNYPFGQRVLKALTAH